MKIATIVATILILIAVLIPGPNLPSIGIGGIDKIVHFGMFCVWAIAVRYDFDSSPFKFTVAFFAGLVFSILTEVLQILVEGRTFDWFDIITDVIGLIAGLLTSGPLLRFLGKRK